MKPLRDASLSWTTLAAAPRAIWIGHTDPVSRSFPELSRGLWTHHQQGTVLREESSSGLCEETGEGLSGGEYLWGGRPAGHGSVGAHDLMT